MRDDERRLHELVLGRRLEELQLQHADAVGRQHLDADRLGGDAQPPVVERLHRINETASRLTKKVGGRHPDVAERHAPVVGRHVERPPEEVDAEAVGIRGHEERGDAARPGLRITAPREAPDFVEISVGCEINSYATAEI